MSSFYDALRLFNFLNAKLHPISTRLAWHKTNRVSHCEDIWDWSEWTTPAMGGRNFLETNCNLSQSLLLATVGRTVGTDNPTHNDQSCYRGFDRNFEAIVTLREADIASKPI